jgi:purine nucleosidase
MKAHRFPTLTTEERLRRLEPPTAGRRPAVVLDTDAANEIDDFFAIAWALASPDRLRLQAMLAVPFSFEHRREAALQRRRDRGLPALDAMHGLCTPEHGMRASHEAMLWMWRLAGAPDMGTGLGEARIVAGATHYVDLSQPPEHNDATRLLIQLAEQQASDEPLYVLSIGCLTNVAQALRIEPELVRRIVVVWTAGYPSHARLANRSFNLEQDLAATRLVFESGVPLVYLPGYHVGAQLRLTAPEVDLHLRGCGPVGEALHRLYNSNPLWPLMGIDGIQPGYSWVIWDLINLAWVMQPDWVPSTLVATPAIDDELVWQPATPSVRMREAHGVDRDAIFGDLFRRLSTLDSR